MNAKLRHLTLRSKRSCPIPLARFILSRLDAQLGWTSTAGRYFNRTFGIPHGE